MHALLPRTNVNFIGWQRELLQPEKIATGDLNHVTIARENLSAIYHPAIDPTFFFFFCLINNSPTTSLLGLLYLLESIGS
jgi:hypothetical protein